MRPIFLCLFLLGQIVIAQNEGYLLFCPCMGRFGNQFETYLGTLNFAKTLNRTLVLAPFLEYPFGETKATIVPFSNVFQVEPLREYHRVVTMEEFIAKKAPKLWPKSERKVFCWGPRKSETDESFGCQAKEGNPFGPFWDYYNVDFADNKYFGDIGYDLSNPKAVNEWNQIYPISKYPVLAFSSAPAHFPIKPNHRHLQSYFKWNKKIEEDAENFVKMHIIRPFVGIHLRNNVDWEIACDHVDANSHFFASSQCTGDNFEFGRPYREMCQPSKEQILDDVKREVEKIGAQTVFVSSDKDHMLSDLNNLFNNTIGIRRLHKDDLYLSLAILGHSDHLIANCMSTYSAFAVRERLFKDDGPLKPYSFFAFKPIEVTKDTIIQRDPINKKVEPGNKKVEPRNKKVERDEL